MYRLLAALSIPVLFVAFTSAAPIPRHLFPKNPTYYFPTTLGTTWVYDDGNSLETQIISKVEAVDGGRMITIEKVHQDGRTPFGILLISTDRVIQLEFQGKKLDEPLLWLKTPPKPGETWEWKFLGAATGTDFVKGVEKLELPAGTFEAMKVDSKYGAGGGLAQATHWYAPGVGLVKSSYGGGASRVLKSFTLGKD
ncbi:MAG TPA: hypothetical protein VG122_24075 [Gemmata sp.]|jgi:hypothetical protein|nr:hypothetical protein [Gemmata sp.]